MAARSMWFKVVSLLVIFVLASANLSVVHAQDGGNPTPTQTPAPGTLPDTPTPAALDTVQATATPTQAAPTPAPLPPTQAPAQSPAQATFNISGTATGADSKGLAGVQVSANRDQQVTTAADGSYTLDGLSPGDYLVEAQLNSLALAPTYRVVHVDDANVSGIDFHVPAQPLPVNASTQAMPVNYAHTLANSLPDSAGEISAQSAYSVGPAGLAYTYQAAKQIGITGAPYVLDPPGAIAHFNAPSAVALDASGNLLEVEEHGNRLVRFNLSGPPASDLVIGDKPGISYMDNYVFNSLMAVAVQPNTGHYWLADSTRLVEYNPGLPAAQRFVSQFPATHPEVTGSDNFHFSEIRGIAFDTSGTQLFVSDRFNNRVQWYSLTGGYPNYVETITGVDANHDNPFNEPWGITYHNGFLYVADSGNHRIQQCNLTTSFCTTFASTTVFTIYIHGEPHPIFFPFIRPTSISFNATNAFIADAERQEIDSCDLNGACVYFAGTSGETGIGNDHFNWPVGVAATAALVYVADQNNQRIQVFNASTGVYNSTIGTTGAPFTTNTAHLDRPWGLAIDPNDNSIYVGENWGYTLKKYNATGTSLLWQIPPENPAAFGSDLHHIGNFQGGNQGNLAVDMQRHVFVPDAGNNRVMVYTSSGNVYGQIGSTWGSDSTHLACPHGVAVSTKLTLYVPSGTIYVADTCNQRVQVFDGAFNLITSIGTTGLAGTDGSHFNQPVAVSVDNNTGNIYVADQANDRVQKCTPSSSTNYTCTPFAGSTGVSDNINFRFLNAPSSVLVDSTNKRVFVAEEQSSRVQVFDMTGAYLTSIGGDWGDQYGRMRNPSGLAINSSGTLYVSDRENARIEAFAPYQGSWTQLNVNGFGEQFNSQVSGLTYYPSKDNSLPFTRMLYTITTRNDGNSPLPASPDSPQVWRLVPGGSSGTMPNNTWQAVSAPGFGDPANTQLVDMALYHNSLYVSTANNNGAQIWRCYNANPLTPTNPCEKPSDWTKLTMPTQPSGNLSHYTIAGRLLNFAGFLAVSLMSYYNDAGTMVTDGGQVWLYDGNAGAWKTKYLALDKTVGAHAFVGVQSLAVFNGNLIAGTSDWADHPFVPAQVWVCTYNSSTANCDWAKQLDFSTIDPNVSAITSLLKVSDINQHDTDLYVGTTGAGNSGASLYHYTTAWVGMTPVLSSANLDPNTSAIRAMILNGSTIYAVTSNSQTGLNIFSCATLCTAGGSWNFYLPDDGFGNPTNTQVEMDSSLIFDPDGRLLVGTWNTVNGGGLWASPVTNHSINGTVYEGASGLDGVTMTLQPGGKQVVTAGGGKYTFSNLTPGSYSVTPTKDKYAFTNTLNNKPTEVVSIVSADVSGVNFTGVKGDVPLQAPANGTQYASLDPVTVWWGTNGIASKFTLEVSTTSDFKVLFKNVTVTTFNYTLSGLKSKTTYFWRVRQAAPLPVLDWSSASVWSFSMPVPPAAPLQVLPASGASLASGVFSPTFTWKAATVPTGSAAVQHYEVQVARQNTFTTLDLDENTQDAVTSYAVQFNLTGNRTYYWRVRAYNSVGDFGAWSSVRTFKTRPQAVTTGWMTDVHTLEPGFSWSDPQCLGKYLLQIYKTSPSRALVTSATVTTGTACQGTYQLTTSLVVGTSYEWDVTAQGANGSSLAMINTFTTPVSVPGVPALSGPAANLVIPAAPAYPDWKPFFTWQAVTTGSPDRYHIQVASQPGFGSSTIEDFAYIPTTSPLQYQMTGPLPYNATVYWRMRACDASDNCSIWATPRKLITRPGKPTILPVSSQTPDITFQWTDPGGNSATSYSMVIYNNFPTCTTVWKNLTSTSTSIHVILTGGPIYCIKVRGVGPTSTITGDYTDLSYIITSIPPAVPVQSYPPNAAVVSAADAFAQSQTPYTVNFTWKASTNATLSTVYDLQVSDFSDFRTLLFNDQNLTGLSQAHDFQAGTYYWRVSAGAGVGGAFSLWSAVHSFSTLGQVWGRITDLQAINLVGVHVTVSGVTGGEDTLAGGNYYLANLSTGAHTITITDAGFLPQTRTLSVAKAGYYFDHLVMAPVQPQGGVYRIVLTWNPAYSTSATLVDNLWLPTTTPLHIINPTVGKSDLTVPPNAMEIMHDTWEGIEVIDVKPPASGNYVFAVNQVNATSYSWSGANARVEVYDNTGTLVKACPQPSGSGAWWHAFDLNTSTSPNPITCKNSISSTSPAPYADHPISGYFTAQNDAHPLQGMPINYGFGTVLPDNNGFYSIPGLVTGSFNLTPNTNAMCSSYIPASPTIAAGTTQNFQCVPAGSLSPGRLNTVAIQGDYAYIGADGWLYVVDIHNKDAPAEVGRLWIDGTTIQDVVVSGKYVYLASWNNYHGEINVVDVSTPSIPMWISSVPVEVHNLALDDQYLVTASGYSINIYQLGPVLTLISTIKLDNFVSVSWVTVSGHYVYAVGLAGLYIYDISNPAHPSGPWHFSVNGFYFHLIVDGEYAYLDANDNGIGDILILNVADPAHISQVADLAINGNRLERVGDILYIANAAQSGGGLIIENVGDPTNAYLDGSFLINGTIDVKVQENYAFILDGTTNHPVHLAIVDVSDPTDPVGKGDYYPAP